jgi:hypothetical protein
MIDYTDVIGREKRVKVEGLETELGDQHLVVKEDG